jgi:RNA polymerase sigma factor (sigma-70 family)
LIQSDDYSHLVERLVGAFSDRLTSQPLFTTDDLRQEIAIYYIYCKDKYDPAKGDFYNFLYTTIKNRIFGLLRDKQDRVKPESIVDIPASIKDDISEYIPWDSLTQIEYDIIQDYLQGYTFVEIAERRNLSKDSVRHRFNEIAMKIKDANE